MAPAGTPLVTLHPSRALPPSPSCYLPPWKQTLPAAVPSTPPVPPLGGSGFAGFSLFLVFLGVFFLVVFFLTGVSLLGWSLPGLVAEGQGYRR